MRDALTLVIVFLSLMALAFLYARLVPQRPTRLREVTVKLTADIDQFVSAMMSVSDVFERIELEEAISQLSAIAGWDHDHTMEVVKTLAGSPADSPLAVARSLMQHVHQGATVTLTDSGVTIKYHTPLGVNNFSSFGILNP